MFDKLLNLTSLFRTATQRIALAGSIWLLTLTSYAADICRTPGFEGMDDNKIRAEAVLPATITSAMDNTSVYVEYHNGVLYYHSNYLTRGFTHPTKVTGDPRINSVFADPAQVFVNIVYAERPSPEVADTARRALKENVDLLLDVSIFDDAGVPRIDLTDVKNVRLVDARRGQSLSVSPEIMATAKPPPSVIAKIKGCCLYGRPPHLSAQFSEEPSKWPFSSKDVSPFKVQKYNFENQWLETSLDDLPHRQVRRTTGSDRGESGSYVESPSGHLERAAQKTSKLLRSLLRVLLKSK